MLASRLVDGMHAMAVYIISRLKRQQCVYDCYRTLKRTMEALIGITGEDFVIMAADRNAARSIVVMKSEDNKFRDLSNNCTICYAGEPGDSTDFAEYIQANVRLYEKRNELPLSPHAIAHYTRRQLADALRTRSRYSTNVLIGGVGAKEDTGPGLVPQLYWLDHLAALTELPFAAHGYAAYFVLSLLDRHWRRGITLPEGLELLRMCLMELKTRFIVNLPHFTVKIIRSSGIEESVMSI